MRLELTFEKQVLTFQSVAIAACCEDTTAPPCEQNEAAKPPCGGVGYGFHAGNRVDPKFRDRTIAE